MYRQRRLHYHQLRACLGPDLPHKQPHSASRNGQQRRRQPNKLGRAARPSQRASHRGLLQLRARASHTVTSQLCPHNTHTLLPHARYYFSHSTPGRRCGRRDHGERPSAAFPPPTLRASRDRPSTKHPRLLGAPDHNQHDRNRRPGSMDLVRAKRQRRGRPSAPR